MASLITSLAERAWSAAQSRGVQVRVKTNVTPELVLFDAAAPSLLEKLGVKYRVEVVTSDGSKIAEYGEPVEFNPVLFVVYGAAIFFAVTLVGASIARLARR